MLGTRRQLIRLTVKNSIICFSFSIARWQHLQTWVITVQLRVGDIAWYGYPASRLAICLPYMYTVQTPTAQWFDH